ncbi:MAG: flagellar M-ring protein FliF [Candidatus Kapabacteria bacterium]|nr:flagellar M-ring protein FliF [Candidatus Kapabacteria bacterium]
MASLPLLDQLKSFAAKLTTIQKVTAGVAVAAAIGGIIMLITSSTQTQMGVLFSELEQKDAATIVDKLKEQNIPYELSNNGSTITVPVDKIHETRLSLAKDGMPVNSTVGYEIFDKTNLGMSDFVQKLNYKRAIEGELQKTISTFNEVQKVRVMIVLPERSLFEKDQNKPTASVHLHLKSGRSLSKLNIEGIQNLVASSVEGLEGNSVTVVDQRGQILSEIKKDNSTLAGLSSTQYEQQQKVDEYLISKVQSLLDGVLGPGNAVVRVNADLDFTQLERTKENYDPDGQVIEAEEKITEAKKSQDSLDYPSVNSESNTGKTRVNYKNSKTIERMVGAVGAIKRISASVLVNGVSKVNENGGDPKIEYTPRSDEEMQKLNQIVRNAIGFDSQRNDQVSVVNMPFDTTALEEEIKNRKWDLPMTPDDIIQKVLLGAAMVLALWMIRKLFASPQVRRRIEEIIAPPKPTSRYEESLRTQQQLSGMVIGPNGQLIPADQMPQLPEKSSMSREELIAKAKSRLDSQLQKEITEEQLLVEEMRVRIQEFFNTNEGEAVKLVKTLLSKGND